MTTLVPKYLDIDFNTLVAKIKEELAASPNVVFRDLNYEGSNISILIELVAYLGELNTYFLNKLAKNMYMETADIYENVNRLARYIGYEPKGYRSGRLTLSVTITDCPTGGIKFPAWKEISSGEQTTDGEYIKYITTADVTYATPTVPYKFDIRVKQGELVTLSGYKGADIIDNEILMPESYAYDDDVDDDYPTIELFIRPAGGTYVQWERVSDFYDDITITSTHDNVFMFVYDKYERSKIVFHSSRNVPITTDELYVNLIKSLGTEGSVGAGLTAWVPDTEFVYDTTNLVYIDNSTLSMTNSAASIGASSPETIATVKENAKAALHAQFRNVTAVDYIAHLESRSDVIAAAAWGEQEIAPSGSIDEYNKVHLSIVPSQWGSSTIDTSASSFTTDWADTAAIDLATVYSSDFVETLVTYLEPRKMLSAYEVFSIPQLVYFSFDFGVRIKRLYTLAEVTTDILNKLIYYFRNANMEFGSIINFMDIYNYIMDITEVSPSDEFTNIKGINNLLIRDIDTSRVVNALNTDGNYPYYTIAAYSGETLLRSIQLGPEQFPVLSSDTIRFTEEV
jgi:hypothetical protein